MEMTSDQVEHFNKLEEICREYYLEVKKHGYDGVNDDLEHYIFEEAMMTILGSDVFKILNAKDKNLANINSLTY